MSVPVFPLQLAELAEHLLLRRERNLFEKPLRRKAFSTFQALLEKITVVVDLLDMHDAPSPPGFAGLFRKMLVS